MSWEDSTYIAPLQRWVNLENPNEVIEIDRANGMRWVVRNGSGMREVTGAQIRQQYRYESG